MAEMKKPAVRSAKPSRAALNSTFSGRPVTAEVPRTAAKDVRARKPVGPVRSLNHTALSEQSFAVSSAPGAERDCELKLEYNKLLQSIFMDCALEESEEKEVDELDVMLARLAERCERNVELLERTHRRLTDITFLGEKQRILEMKSNDCTKFYKGTSGDAARTLDDLSRRQQAYLDRAETSNVELGYNERSGHQQLLDAMEDVLQGFESIRSQSKLTPSVLEQLEESHRGLRRTRREATDLEELRRRFAERFPELSERALVEGSAELARRMEEQLGLNSDAE